MKPKFIFRIAAGSALLLGVNACSLDYDPIGRYSDVTEGVENNEGKKIAFKDRAAVASHRQTIRDQIRDRQEHWYSDFYLISEAHTDNAYAGTPDYAVRPYENNSIDGANMLLERDWNRYMEDIARANKLICNIDSVDDVTLTTAERNQYKAEAKIFRAMIYFDMARIWGSIPVIITEAGDITSETVKDVYGDYFPPQNTELEVYQQIEKDLLEALEYAPAPVANDKTQFSKAVANTLLAKVYAEKPLRDYAKVIQYCDAVAVAGFDLANNFNDLFGVTLQNNTLPPSQTNPAIGGMRNTQESILEAQFPGAGNWLCWMWGRDLTNWNLSYDWAKWNTPSRDLIKAYADAGDVVRSKETIVYYACTWSNYYPSENYPFFYKYRSAYSTLIKFRYADVLLLKAEALIMQDNSDLNGAAAIIDRIRNRAGLPALSASVKSSKANMLNAYLKERRLELAFEGQRWYDLVRLDKVEEVMNGLNARDAGRMALAYPFTANSYRFPIPQSAIDKNPNLVQNQGY
jgi:hypothetical protein